MDFFKKIILLLIDIRFANKEIRARFCFTVLSHFSDYFGALNLSDSLVGCRRKFAVRYDATVHENECANVPPLIVSVSDALLHNA